MPKKEDCIAVFDSGVGGISVLRSLVAELPAEHFVYFGDCANAPYGTKTPETVRLLTLAAADKLFARGAKALVVACNTATAAAIDTLRQRYPQQIIVGIEPAVKVAFDHFPRGRIGVIATPVTLQEERFAHLAQNFSQMEITSIPLPGLVELIEAGKDEKALLAFLQPTLGQHENVFDAVVLGCTHYPLIAPVFQKLFGKRAALLDGAKGTAQQTKRRLEAAGLLSDGPGQVEFVTSSQDPGFAGRCRKLL